MIVGVIGSGAMGSGIAQVAATAGCEVRLFDKSSEALDRSKNKLLKILNRQVEKGRMTDQEVKAIFGNIYYIDQFSSFNGCDLVIEAVYENLELKQSLFKDLEGLLTKTAIMATNTSSLSVAAIAGACKHPERVIGIHFFNPAPLMKLVEIIPAVQTNQATLDKARATIDGWGKITVQAKDTPGFIVNRVARPFYGEALRILEEGIADAATIDWAMTELGGFKMGPFALMDYIGHDVNYTVTETVFKSFFYDPRYKPSFSQKRMVESGRLGRKTGMGFFDYNNPENNPDPNTDRGLGAMILGRIMVMLINEAADACFWQIAKPTDIDLAMTKGVNYPKGLLEWANDWTIEFCVEKLDELYDTYREDRYRCSPILRKMVQESKTFFPERETQSA